MRLVPLANGSSEVVRHGPTLSLLHFFRLLLGDDEDDVPSKATSIS